MAPLKSSLARTVGKLLGVQKDADLSLRGNVQRSRLSGFSASGGLTVENGGYKYHVFTSDSTFSTSQSFDVETVVVGGGGGGYPGAPAGGGGGGGGVLISTVPVTGPVAVTVGTGGAAEGDGGTSYFGPKTSPGGKGATSNDGVNSYPSTPSSGPELFQSGTGTSSSGDVGGGGGGANGNGGPAVGPACGGTGAAGGSGKQTNFPGPAFTPIMPGDFVAALGPQGYFGGGGAGAIRCAPGSPNVAGPGGVGGGGPGGSEIASRSGANGTANTGGGAGGGHSYGGVGGAGGPGIVIVRYPSY